MTHMCMRQTPECHPQCRVVSCVSPVDLLGGASSRRGAYVAIRCPTQNLSTVADLGFLVSAAHMCSQYRHGAQKSPRGAITERLRTRLYSRIQLVGSAVLSGHVCVTGTHKCLLQMPGNWTLAEDPGHNCVSPVDPPSGAGSGRGACAATTRHPTQHTSTVAGPGCLVSESVIATQARR